ncbi:hypothetical protein V1260_08170 [Brachybacterium sp. J144]|uniref:hypothetical protein n=1 Tax=Brachybacterium sp. J144 TaxID=3116487 RepID=UPI002E79A5B5|nr:hypothetical protein [Brachybacterium sp. J144]MEE1650768.1 hypothetical protein [Brachybacterium sp. J144]
MFRRLQRTRQLRRAKPGDGRELSRLRWWQILTRTQFALPSSTAAGRPELYVVDVHHLASDLEGGKLAEGTRHPKIALYRDGRRTHIADSPVAFEVPGGVIEAAVGDYGLTRMHLVPEDGGEATTLVPHPRSLEGRRARFGRRHPAASRLIGLLAIVILLIGVVLMLPQAAELITSIPPVADRIGTFTSPISLPGWLNISLLIAGVLAATERALTLRNHWLIDAETTWTSFV